MANKKQLNDMRKKRDISRAYHDKEGSIADLAGRFHASTATVQVAIKHDVDWWQAEIDKLATRMATTTPGGSESIPYKHEVLSLFHINGKDGKPGYQLKRASGGTPSMVEGTIDDVLDALSKDGWEVVQLVAGGGDWSNVIMRRPSGR